MKKQIAIDVIILVLFLAVSIITFFYIDSKTHSGSDTLYGFVVPFFIVVLSFLIINFIIKKLISKN